MIEYRKSRVKDLRELKAGRYIFVWGAVCVKIQLHDFNNVSRCAVSYWYFQYQDAYSVILVFINTSVKSALCHTGIYKYQCQDA